MTGTLELVGGCQLKSTWCGFPVPLSPTVIVEFVEELLVTLSCPVADPVAVGLNVSVKLNVWPGFSVAGKFTAEAEKPLPVTETPLTVTGAVPLEFSVTVCVVELFTTTPPNEMLLALTLRADFAAFNCRERDFEVPPVLAVSVAD